ncbi:hypothetical protein QT784_22870, partial [Xanthomonas citri pv. citri]
SETAKAKKDERDPNTLDLFVPMTDNQRLLLPKKSLYCLKLRIWQKGKRTAVMKPLPSKLLRIYWITTNKRFIYRF